MCGGVTTRTEVDTAPHLAAARVRNHHRRVDSPQAVVVHQRFHVLAVVRGWLRRTLGVDRLRAALHLADVGHRATANNARNLCNEKRRYEAIILSPSPPRSHVKTTHHIAICKRQIFQRVNADVVQRFQVRRVVAKQRRIQCCGQRDVMLPQAAVRVIIQRPVRCSQRKLRRGEAKQVTREKENGKKSGTNSPPATSGVHRHTSFNCFITSPFTSDAFFSSGVRVSGRPSTPVKTPACEAEPVF